MWVVVYRLWLSLCCRSGCLLVSTSNADVTVDGNVVKMKQFDWLDVKKVFIYSKLRGAILKPKNIKCKCLLFGFCFFLKGDNVIYRADAVNAATNICFYS